MSEADLPRGVVEQELRRVLDWPGLARSPQLAKFLNYVVKARLDGDMANIKAYSIAVDVFGRPATFDPQSDPIVRVQARRLRALLEEYYGGAGAQRPIRFYLPVGRYVPEFMVSAPLAQPEGPVAPPQPAPESPPQADGTAPRAPAATSAWLAEGLAFLLALAVVIVAVVGLANLLGPRTGPANLPVPPRIAIAEFTTVADRGGGTTTNASGLAIELVTDLDLFADIVPSYLDPAASSAAGPIGAAADPNLFVLTGLSRRDGMTEQITATLRQAGSDAVLWTMTVGGSSADGAADIDSVSRGFAEQLGSHRGPLHARAIAWLDANTVPAGWESEYLCGLLFSKYRDSGLAMDSARATECVARLLERDAGQAIALAMRASLAADTAQANSPPGAPDASVLSAARADIAQALQLAPTSSFVWEQNARLLEMTGIIDDAEAAYSSAYQLNPAYLDAKAAFARLLTLQGPSERGEQLARDAVAAAIAAPHWYYAAPAVAAFRRSDFVVAISSAQQLIKGDAELGTVIATVSARHTGADSALNRYFAQMLDVARFRRFGILPVLRQRIGDSTVVQAIATELAAAGVSATALNGTF